MTFSFADALSVVQIAVYVPCFLLALVLCSRHGWSKSSGWTYLITFTCLRIISSACQLIDDSNPSKEVKTAYIITSSIGISPLTLLSLGLLSRVNDNTVPRLSAILFLCIPLSSMVGMILGIVGGVKQSQSSTPLVPTTSSKVAVANFALIFLVVNVILVILLIRLANVKKGEKRLLFVVSVSMPFILLRVIYALISDFGSNPDFGALTGSTTIFCAMAVVPEMVVALISLTSGFTLRVIPKDEKDKDVLPVRSNLSRLHSDHFQKAGVYGGQVDRNSLYPPQQFPSGREPLTPETPRTPRRRGPPLTAIPRLGRDAKSQKDSDMF
ncbi:hypothetical protein MMC11_003657 [Xylographa trunciseda]|nr:hypothetical protein [Xylographa trunciseda]